MNFIEWLDVYHGSKTPLTQFDSKKQLSGYYPGFYTTSEEERAKSHGDNITQLTIYEDKFYSLDNPQKADELKDMAAKAGFRTSSASGYAEVQYLKQEGYAGIRRGNEFIVFEPEKWF